MHFVMAQCLWILVRITAALSMLLCPQSPPTPTTFPSLHPPCGQHMREAAERRQQLELEHEQALAVLNAKQQEIDLLQKVRGLSLTTGFMGQRAFWCTLVQYTCNTCSLTKVIVPSKTIFKRAQENNCAQPFRYFHHCAVTISLSCLSNPVSGKWHLLFIIVIIIIYKSFSNVNIFYEGSIIAACIRLTAGDR